MNLLAGLILAVAVLMFAWHLFPEVGAWIEHLRMRRWIAARVRELQAISAAMREAAAAFRSLNEALDRFAGAMDEAYAEALVRDPGLQDAIIQARQRDPSIGWLDVAARRGTEVGR